jgi:hypothetical protein
MRLTGARAAEKAQSQQPHNRSAGCSIQAKNNVTSRVRLDEKYAERRAVQKPIKPQQNFARVFGVFLQRDARLESSFPAIPLAQLPTLGRARKVK